MIPIPKGVALRAEGKTLIAKGPAGEVRKIVPRGIEFKLEGSGILLTGKDRALLYTIDSVVKSMLHGADSGFRKDLRLLYAHFPISVEVKGKQILIKNFLGEKTPRKTKVAGDTKVVVKGQDVSISGPDKEAVGQTAANMKIAMKIKHKDPRVFQDGIFEPITR